MAIEKRFILATLNPVRIRLVFWCPDVNFANVLYSEIVAQFNLGGLK